MRLVWLVYSFKDAHKSYCPNRLTRLYFISLQTANKKQCLNFFSFSPFPFLSTTVHVYSPFLSHHSWACTHKNQLPFLSLLLYLLLAWCIVLIVTVFVCFSFPDHFGQVDFLLFIIMHPFTFKTYVSSFPFFFLPMRMCSY